MHFKKSYLSSYGNIASENFSLVKTLDRNIDSQSNVTVTITTINKQ